MSQTVAAQPLSSAILTPLFSKLTGFFFNNFFSCACDGDIIARSSSCARDLVMIVRMVCTAVVVVIINYYYYKTKPSDDDGLVVAAAYQQPYPEI